MPLETAAQFLLVSSGCGGNSGMHGPRLLWRRNKPAFRNYAVAVVSTAVALGIARWLDVHFESAPVSLFLCAVLLSAWLGGAGPHSASFATEPGPVRSSRGFAPPRRKRAG